MRLDKSQDQTQMKLRIDLGIGSGVRSIHKFTKSITETISKMDESKTYDEVIDNPIHGNR